MKILPDMVAGLLGLVFIAVGVGLIFVPAAFIVVGVLILTLSLFPGFSENPGGGR